MLALVPTWYIALVVVLFGVVVGSFLNVVIYRFHTGRSLNGRSHCLSCGHHLRWYELVPVVSYLFLRGRCARCGSHIPVRYVVVESMTAVIFLLLWSQLGDPILLVLSWLVAALLVVIAVYDWYHYIIPDRLVVLVVAVTIGWCGYRWFGGVSLPIIGYDVLAATAAAGFLGSLWFVSKGTWIGFGDVKLVWPLALLVGYAHVFSFVVLSFWVGAAISLVVLAVQWWRYRGQPALRTGGRALTMKSAVPFGPFLIAGFFISFLFQINVLTLFNNWS